LPNSSNIDFNYLAEKAKTIRIHIINMLTMAGSGHPGGSLSAADILSALFFHELNHNPDKPEWADRDRFILSKGHASPVLYATLAECGYFPIKYLNTLRKIGSSLQGHPDKLSLPGVEMSTGSLGQGLSLSTGLALGLLLNKKQSRVYTLLGDGEIQEGMVWEAAMAAAHYKVDNLVAILDRNTLQIDGPTEEVMALSSLKEKWQAFGWQVITIDGHNLEQICFAFQEAKTIKGKPTMIIANTIKGKGVSFMEGQLKYHGVAPSEEEKVKALEELA